MFHAALLMFSARFMSHCSLASAGRASVPAEHLPDIMGQETVKAEPSEENQNVRTSLLTSDHLPLGHSPVCFQLIITILAGVPGCHKDGLCKILTGLSKDENR